MRESDTCSAVQMYMGQLDAETPQNMPGIPENLVRLLAEFEVKPAKFPIITPDDEMVAGWVNVH